MKRTESSDTQSIWNVPNILTMLRMALIAVFIYAYKQDAKPWALVVFWVASLTDFLDGYIARRTNTITSFGKLMDPLADKLLLISALACLMSDGVVPSVVLIVIVSKELLMMIVSMYMLRKGVVVYAKFVGKLATVLFMIAVTLSFFHEWVAPIDQVLMYASMAVSVLAMISYGISMLKALKTQEF